jgi:type II secretory pathway pseudopilin PulG
MRRLGLRKRRLRRGFTLLEVLGATMLVTTGLMTAFFMVGMGTKVNTDAKNLAQAYQAAQQEIEILRNIPWQQSGTFTGLGSVVQLPLTTVTSDMCYENRFLLPNGNWDASRPSDTNLNGQTYPGLVPALGRLPNGRGGLIITGASSNAPKSITVIVRWTDPGNQERVIAVGTVITKGGIDPR